MLKTTLGVYAFVAPFTRLSVDGVGQLSVIVVTVADLASVSLPLLLPTVAVTWMEFAVISTTAAAPTRAGAPLDKLQLTEPDDLSVRDATLMVHCAVTCTLW